MEAYVKRFSDFRTIKLLNITAHEIVLDSLEREPSTVTADGEPLSHENIGDWLIFENAVYRITGITPKKSQTTVKLTAPIDAFQRLLELTQQAAAETIGGFVQAALIANWAECPDPAYVVPYLVVSNSDTTPYAAPELDDMGCFRLSDYCRLMRKSYFVKMEFSVDGDILRCDIKNDLPKQRQVSFEDGRSQLQAAAFAAGGLAKLTILCDRDTGEKDEQGEKILVRERSDWYLSATGDVVQEAPEERAHGEWDTILIKEDDDPLVKATEAFAKKQGSHKLEFWSRLDLAVQDRCTFFVSGALMTSNISYKRKASADARFYYKSGELATTATEKLRGATK